MDLATGTLIRDRYEVVGKLGAASWKVRDRQTDAFGVLKRLTGRGVADADTLKARLEERRALTVPGLPAIHDVLFVEVERKDEWFVVREFVDGVSLQDAVGRQRGLNPDHVRWLGGELLWLLEQLHDADLVHGDVNPSNVLLAEDGTEVWLVDHGQFKAAARSGLAGGWSLASDAAYAAPEAAMGGVGARSDLYALGQTLVFALTGRPPSDVDRDDLAGAGKGRGYDVDRGLVQVILKLGEPLAEGRFESASQATRAMAHGLPDADAGREWWERDFFLEPDDDARSLALKTNAFWFALAVIPVLACVLVLLPPLGTFTESFGTLLQAGFSLGLFVVGGGALATAVPWLWAGHHRMVHVNETSLAAHDGKGWLRVPWRQLRRVRRFGPILLLEGSWERDDAIGQGSDSVALMDVYDVELARLEGILRGRRPPEADHARGPDPEGGLVRLNLIAGLPPVLQVGIAVAGVCIPAFGFLAIAWGAGLLHRADAPDRSSWESDRVERSSGPWEDRVPNPVSTGGVGDVPELIWAMACPPGMFASSVKAHGHRLMSCEDLNGEMVGVPGVSGTDMAPFMADRTEIPVRLYEACVTAGTCAPPAATEGCNWGVPGREAHPINCVDFERAVAFCEWSHKRVCSGDEFERLAGGLQRYAYPWGGTPPSCELAVMDQDGAGCGKSGTWAIGSHAEGSSPVGMLDASGNVAEWTSDAKVRGGSFRSAAGADLLTTAAVGGIAGPDVGIRCCKSY